jgi:hypothetical protein
MNNLNNIRSEASRQFRNKIQERLNDKTNELAMNSKNKNIRQRYRAMNEFKKGCQPRNNLVNGENDYLLADHNNMLEKWKNDVSQLLNVYWASDIRQIEIYRAELLVPEPSPFEDEIALQS